MGYTTCRQEASTPGASSDSSGTWRSDGTSNQQTQNSKAESAPVTSGQVREHVPARSSTFPQLGTLQSVKDTAKLRVEKFKVGFRVWRPTGLL